MVFLCRPFCSQVLSLFCVTSFSADLFGYQLKVPLLQNAKCVAPWLTSSLVIERGAVEVVRGVGEVVRGVGEVVE